jgi:hypothetical protein
MLTKFALGLALSAALPAAALADEGVLPIGATDSNTQVVVRDAQTGKLRAATAEEHAALHEQRAAKRSALRSASATPQTKFHASGAVGVRMTDDMMSYSVVARGADGKLVEQCFASKAEADAAVKNGILVGKTALATE